MSKRIINILAMVIIVAWVISFILEATMKTYDPPQTVHSLMLIVAGAAFTGTRLASRNGNGNP